MIVTISNTQKPTDEIPIEANIISPNSEKDNKESCKTNEIAEINDQNIPVEEHIFTRCIRYCVFTFIVSFEITNNLENGTIPAAIDLIKKSLDITSTQIGIFGSLSFFGNTLGSLLSMWSLYKINRKWLLIIHMILSGIFLFAFTLTKNIPYLYFNRIKVGVVQVLDLF